MVNAIHPVTLTERAAEEIRKIMTTKNIPQDYGLRVGVRGGGCGVAWMIGFDKKKESDLSYIIADIPVYVDKKHTLFVIGKQVDFIDCSEGRGFTLIDPGKPVE